MSLPKIGYPTYDLELPSSGKKVKFRPYTVKEEKVLLLALESRPDPQLLQQADPKDAKEAVDNWEESVKDAVRDLLKNCVMTRIKVEDLPEFDLGLLFIRIRSASSGPTVQMNVTFADGSSGETVIDLNEVDVHFPEGHEKQIDLGDGAGLVMKYPTMERFIEAEFLKKGFAEDEALTYIAECIDKAFDEEQVHNFTVKEAAKWLGQLTPDQFESIAKFFETAPVLQHKFQVRNGNTGELEDFTINGLSGFFG